jgi:hypothetical protein
MSRIDDAIDVRVPIATAYNQWTQFEEYPRFMEGVDRVVQLDDSTLEWTATIGGQTRSWRARIVDQVPEERIAWVSTSGARNNGVVTFRPLAADRTRISLAMEIEPDGVVESTGDALGVPANRVRGDLERFRDFIEQRGVATGAWRGTVPDDLAGDVSAQPAPDPAGFETSVSRDSRSRAGLDDEATGRGFAEGLASPDLTRKEPVGTASRSRADLDDEATGRGFAEGLASPELTRKEPDASSVAEPSHRRSAR